MAVKMVHRLVSPWYKKEHTPLKAVFLANGVRLSKIVPYILLHKQIEIIYTICFSAIKCLFIHFHVVLIIVTA